MKTKFRKTSLILTFLLVSVCLFGVNMPTVQAATNESFLEQIAQLKAQIIELQRQLSETQGGKVVWCHGFNVNLKIGDSSSEVGALRSALTREGFSGLEAMGGAYEFDERVASAVVGFQEKYASDILVPWGLKHGTGYVGSTTRSKLNNLYGCKEVVKPSTKVLSPNGGEEWAIGETRRVSWQSSTVKYVRIYIYDETISGSGSTNYIFDGALSADTGYYDWTIQQSQLPGGNSLPRNYRIRIDGLTDPDLGAEPLVQGSSDNTFRISSVVQPFITVISPNGGERWQRGRTYNIQWQSSGVEKLYISSAAYDEFEHKFLMNNLAQDISASSGTYSWEIPSTWPIGERYKIEIGAEFTIATEQSGLTDESNNYFSIIEPSVAVPSIAITSVPKADSDSKVTIQPGDQIVITGVPSNLSGQMGVDYTRAFFFDPIFDGGCANTDWAITCTAEQTGISNFYIELYKNSQTYKSNTIQVTVECLQVSPQIPEMVYPVNVQALNYGLPHGYMFKVKPITGASGYHYQFLQEGVIVYDNINNLSSGSDFALWPDSPGYSSLKEGDVTVKINAMFGDQPGPIRTITIKLGQADFRPTQITYNPASIRVGDTVFFDSGIENTGYIPTGLFNIKWFVDDVEVGYGSHGGVPNNSVVMNGNSQYTWVAAEGSHTIKFIVDADNHIKESDETNNTISLNLTVLATPLIAVTLPNGGENLMKGSTYRIQWATTGYGSDASVQIGLRDARYDVNIDKGEVTIINTINSGSYSWAIPSTTEVGSQFKIVIYIDGGGPGKYDLSDDYFSIVEPFFSVPLSTETEILKDMESQMASVSAAISRLMEGIKELME